MTADESPGEQKGQPGLLSAALSGLCPRCGARTLFAAPAALADKCSKCGLDFLGLERGGRFVGVVTMLLALVLILAALGIDASALLVYRAAWTKDMVAARVSREAAMAKLHATETAQKVIDAAVQLHGGDGVKSGEVVESLYREIRALRIYEGASDVQKVVIARQTMANSTGG